MALALSVLALFTALVKVTWENWEVQQIYSCMTEEAEAERIASLKETD